MTEEYNNIYNVTKNLTVLYAEDDEVVRKNTILILDKFFKNIDIACDGEECYYKYLSYHKDNDKYHDLVFSDIEMPYMNGVDLSKKIYQKNQNQTIIIISAYNDPKYLMEFINMKIVYFLLKPFELKDILSIFTKILDDNDLFIKTTMVKLNHNLYFDLDRLELLFNNQQIKLTKKEILFMELLIKNNGNIVTYDNIYYYLWDMNMGVASPKRLNPIISKLKKKIPLSIIENIYGMGYKLNI